MSALHTWAKKWGVSTDMLRDLQTVLGLYTPALGPLDPAAGKSEAYAQSVVMLEAAAKGVSLFRNNVGVLTNEDGRPVRYGLANDSKKVNALVKSGDLIGIRPLLITPDHVGHTLGQFISREVKAPGWQYSGTPHEEAQARWANLINSKGGDACFTTGEGTL